MVAEAEGELQELLADAVPPYDPELVQQVLMALPKPGRWHQWIALLPIAASLLVVACGALLVGGIPGSSLLPLLPQWSSQGWTSLLQGLFDWSVVLPVAANILHVKIAFAVTAGLVAIAGSSLTSLLLLAQRQRQIHRWQEAG
jgi:hypothetical protein